MTQYAVKKDSLDEFKNLRHEILNLKEYLDPDETGQSFSYSDLTDKIDLILTKLNDLQQSSIPAKHYSKTIKKDMQRTEDRKEDEGVSKAMKEIEKKAMAKLENGECDSRSEAISQVVKSNPALWLKDKREREERTRSPSPRERFEDND